MIVKNEAHCLADCLRSVRPIADEILVGDTGSTDDSAAIAESFGAVVLDVPWHDDFSEARNAVLDAAKADWLLHIDADEALDIEGAAQIKRIVADPPCDAVELLLANYCDDTRAWRWKPATPGNPMARGWAGYIEVPLLRLFRNRCGFHYREPVHENITESVIEYGGRISRADILIHHYGYGTIEQRARKNDYYLELAQKKVLQYPNLPKAWQELAELLFSTGDAAGAEAACRTALALAPTDVSAATTLANLLLNRGETREARSWLERIEANGARYPHVQVALAAIDYKQGRLKEALRRLASAKQIDPRHVQACLYLARVLDCLRHHAEAEQELKAAACAAPSIPEIKNRLLAFEMRQRAEIELAHGNHTPALALLTKALNLDPEDPLIYINIGNILQKMGMAERAAESFSRAAKLTLFFNVH
jgi:tetratricopeptide (TPR) repeat protein